MSITQEIGRAGEQAAAEWLHRNGFELLHRNWRQGRYELDIVARRAGIVHFIEVKARREGSLTSPEQAITPAKARALFQAAQAYIAHNGVDLETQFDLIAVQGEEIRYIPGAMAPSW